MEYRILGPLQVCEGNAAVPLGGERRRTLLALLLLSANEVVSSDRLCEELWHGSPPRTAATALQVQVSQLRKVLEPDHTPGTPYSVLVTEPPGYTLKIDPADFDLNRFRRLREEGREALADGRPRAASRLLRTALALWRGPPLADVSFQPSVQDAIARLEEERLAVLEERLEADLAIGLHTGVIPELEWLCENFPLRERARALLMLALYRSGRQADALETYRKAQHKLRDDLGIDPSPALSELQRAILNQDPTLSVDVPSRTAKTNVPIPATPLVGREREVASTCALLLRSDIRLLTLTGAGGTGKTRLALEVAQRIGKDFGDGVCLIRLGRLSDPALVVPTIARTLAVGERAGEPIGDTLEAYLHDRELLLLLDNFEHLLDAATGVAQLLEASASLKVLATSRAPLRLLGEHEYPVPPLATSEAMSLFVQRATAANPNFALTSRNEAAVTEICIRLDGLPLALELAAARCRLLAPEAIVDRLDHRLGLLTGGPRDLPIRQQTLRDTIAWSYDLLTTSEQHLFKHLGVFAGGCTADAAEVVTNADEALDGLSSLLDKSLLFQRESGDEPYFAMLNTIREYAREELEKGGESETARARHAAWYSQLAERAEPELKGSQQALWLARLEREHDNLRLALAWAHQSDDHELLVRLAAALARFWAVHGYLTEGREWLEAALQTERPVRPELRANTLLGAFILAHRLGDLAHAQACADESLAICKELGDQAGIARSLTYLGLVAKANGDGDLAQARLTEAAAFAREIGDTWTLAASVSNQGDLALVRGDYTQARELCGESLVLQRALGDTRGAAISLSNIAYAYLYEGRFRDATEPLRESLQLAFELGDRDGIAYRLEALAVAAAAENETERAARLLGSANGLFEGIGAGLEPAERRLHEATLLDVRTRLGDEAFAAAWAAGRAMGVDEAVAYARQERLVAA